jgi:hypothetical protein
MKLHKWEDVRRRNFTPKEIAKLDAAIEAELLEMNLTALRAHAMKTQAELARAAKMTQPEVSATERRSDHLVSTLRRYVTALGGELEVSARFGDVRIQLKGV